ncbi:MAG: hypothetical protein RIS70_969 [Planctomycetota bacterium]
MSNRSQFTGSLSLNELAILNTEIAALVHAGVPLPRGLRDLSSDLSGRLAQSSRVIAERLERGESLTAVLGDPQLGLPKVYQAVVEAGARSGNLVAALEGTAESLQRSAAVRRMTRMAIIYPLMVAALAYFGLVLFFLQTLPTLLAIYDDSRTEPIRVIEALRVIEGWNVVWMPAVPVILLVLVAAWWWRGQRASSLDRFEPSNKLATRNFSARTMRYAGEVATFSDLMRLLIEHHMTTHEAISLAARCCANARFVADADTLAEQIRMGQAASVDLRQRSTIPSLLRWALINAVGRETLVESLRVASRSYHELATEIHANLRLVVPTALMLLIGSSTLLAYSLVSFLPWFLFMKELAAS